MANQFSRISYSISSSGSCSKWHSLVMIFLRFKFMLINLKLLTPIFSYNSRVDILCQVKCLQTASCRAFQFQEGKCTFFDLADLPNQIIVNLNLEPNIWIKNVEEVMQLKRQVNQRSQKGVHIYLKMWLCHFWYFLGSFYQLRWGMLAQQPTLSCKWHLKLCCSFANAPWSHNIARSEYWRSLVQTKRRDTHLYISGMLQLGFYGWQWLDTGRCALWSFITILRNVRVSSLIYLFYFRLDLHL